MTLPHIITTLRIENRSQFCIQGVDRMVPILREGDTIQTKDGRRGVVFYINRRIKHYQVIYRDDYQELVRFEDVKKAANG